MHEHLIGASYAAAMTDMNPPRPMQPQPTPFQIGAANLDDGNILIRVMTVTGMTVLFTTPEGAEGIAEQLTKAAAQARTGPTLPPRLALPGRTRPRMSAGVALKETPGSGNGYRRAPCR